jgi:hypothetical protein
VWTVADRWRVAHEILNEISTRCGESHVIHARAGSRRRRPGTLLPRCPYARWTAGPAGAHTYALSGRKHCGNLSHFLGFQPMRPAARWRRRIESESPRVRWCAVPSRSARTYQHRRRCRRPFHPLVGAVRRRSRSRNRPWVCCSRPLVVAEGVGRPAARASPFHNRSKLWWSRRIGLSYLSGWINSSLNTYLGRT